MAARFDIVYAPEVLGHLAHIELKFHGLIRRSIAGRLGHDPLSETRNRKPLDPPAPFGATWELRFGPGNRFRAFYEVDVQAGQVNVLAIGVKDGNRLSIGGERIDG